MELGVLHFLNGKKMMHRHDITVEKAFKAVRAHAHTKATHKFDDVDCALMAQCLNQSRFKMDKLDENTRHFLI